MTKIKNPEEEEVNPIGKIFEFTCPVCGKVQRVKLIINKLNQCENGECGVEWMPAIVMKWYDKNKGKTKEADNKDSESPKK